MQYAQELTGTTKENGWKRNRNYPSHTAQSSRPLPVATRFTSIAQKSLSFSLIYIRQKRRRNFLDRSSHARWAAQRLHWSKTCSPSGGGLRYSLYKMSQCLCSSCPRALLTHSVKALARFCHHCCLWKEGRCIKAHWDQSRSSSLVGSTICELCIPYSLLVNHLCIFSMQEQWLPRRRQASHIW
jgi:hypothetical protein